MVLLLLLQALPLPAGCCDCNAMLSRLAAEDIYAATALIISSYREVFQTGNNAIMYISFR
jgi:hypothetical protein